MNKKKILVISMLIIVMVVLLIDSDSTSNPLIHGKTCGVSNALAASLPSEPIAEWQNYQDLDYGFTIAYPVGWDYQVTIDQSIPYSNPQAIIKRLTFTGNEGVIDFDIWLARDLSQSMHSNLNEWMTWYSKTRYKIPVNANAKVAGDEAVAFTEGSGSASPMLTVFFSDGDYVYRLWYSLTEYEAGLQLYQHMLDTLILSGRELSVAEIPNDVWNDAKKAAKESGVVNPLESSCCGYYSSGNPFECCSNKGNCTWWIYYNYGYVPFRGDAGTWYSKVPDYPGWQRGSQPSLWRPNIAWWSGSPGHVAYLDNYTGGTSITISEMKWCTSCGQTRTIPYTNPDGYIWAAYAK